MRQPGPRPSASISWTVLAAARTDCKSQDQSRPVFCYSTGHEAVMSSQSQDCTCISSVRSSQKIGRTTTLMAVFSAVFSFFFSLRTFPAPLSTYSLRLYFWGLYSLPSDFSFRAKSYTCIKRSACLHGRSHGAFKYVHLLLVLAESSSFPSPLQSAEFRQHVSSLSAS